MTERTCIVPVEFLADYFGVDVRTIQNYAKSDGMPKLQRGNYDLVKCAKWQIDKLTAQIEQMKREKPQDNLAARNAELRELTILEKMNELIDSSMIEDLWLNEISVIVTNFDGFIANRKALLKTEEEKTELEQAANKFKEQVGRVKIKIPGTTDQEFDLDSYFQQSALAAKE